MMAGGKAYERYDRRRIQFGLEAYESARAITKAIDVHLTTATREIRKHTDASANYRYGKTKEPRSSKKDRGSP